MDTASLEPLVMSFNLLREITNGFSEERKLGSGSYGKVYLGENKDGEKIAVKMLYDMPGVDDQHFQNEFKNLTRLCHQNIVRLVGYCHDIQEVQVKHEGKLVLAEKTHRALCLEYMSNGSLEKYLSDECDRYDWQKGYRIIKGVCQGLNYLHNELKPPIYHLDLKPANVLLDENMNPRIADFGISRLFRDEQTQATKSSLGTIGYLPPEYTKFFLISSKFDIFSLGVVILKIMAGRAGYFNSTEMPSQEFTNIVHENWMNRLLETSNRRAAYSQQVKICIEIGLSCVEEDRHKRPTIQDIIDRLNETETECTYAARKDWLLIFQEANRNTCPQNAPDPNGRHAEQIYHGSTFNQDIVGTSRPSYFEENVDSQFYRNDNGDCPSNNYRDYLTIGNPLPGIERFQIAGDPRPGFTLAASFFPTNGTTHCNFQWVRYLGDGSRQPIEGATMYDYVVTADNVGTLLAVECTPMDNNGQQGNLVTEFANNESKIDDPVMQHDIDTYISTGRAQFDVFVLLGYTPDEWKKAMLVLTRTGYQIYFSHKDEAVIDQIYSPGLQTKIPIGRTTEFLLVRSGVVHLPFNTRGISGPGSEDKDFRLRDVIVLVMRTFQSKFDLATEFASSESKITCDPVMQRDIDIYTSIGRAQFDVFILLGYSDDEWKQATLVLTRTGYQIFFRHKDEAVIDQTYSPRLQTKIPIGRTTQFLLVGSGVARLPFNTRGIARPNSEDNDIRLRDLIVLVMRTFQKMDHLVTEFASSESKITCDPVMQRDIDIYTSSGRAQFDVFILLGYSPDVWKMATLVLTRTGYQIFLSHKDEAVIDQKYSPGLQAKIPIGRTTQFLLVGSGVAHLPFNTRGIARPNSEDNDIRCQLTSLRVFLFAHKG